jgi:hypothetical protein
MQSLSFIVAPDFNRWVLTVGRTYLGEHATPERALKAAFDMARRTRGDNRVFLMADDGGLEQQWPSQLRV